MAVQKKSIWLSYDFGLRGNYTGLFTFLDNHKALDCGNGLAYFIYDNPEMLDSTRLIEKLKKELSEMIEPSQSDRIYVIWKDDDGEYLDSKPRVNGKFLFGQRKSPAWNGYATNDGNNKMDEAF